MRIYILFFKISDFVAVLSSVVNAVTRYVRMVGLRARKTREIGRLIHSRLVSRFRGLLLRVAELVLGVDVDVLVLH